LQPWINAVTQVSFSIPKLLEKALFRLGSLSAFAPQAFFLVGLPLLIWVVLVIFGKTWVILPKYKN
jgi:hypothetical protein